ncbi:MAG: hypothetical protein ABI662_01340 [Dermatophilaceae bacterium]
MEIIEYLEIARSRKWVLLGVPILAAAATSAIVLGSPATFSATATISPAALVGGAAGNQYNGSQAVSQYVAAFQATATGPAVRRAVSSSTQIPTSEIADGLDVSQVGASSAMTITYTDTKLKNVEPALTALTQGTLKAMFGSQVDLAQGQVDTATAEVTSAGDAIVAWEKQSGMVDPDRIYQSRIDQINTLTTQRVSLLANGNAAGAAATAATIATTKASLPAFAPLLAQYHALTARQTGAQSALTTALQSLQQSKAQLGAADPAKVTFIGSAQRTDSTSTLATTVLPVTGASLFAAIAIIAILELLSRNRAVAEPTPTLGQDGSRPRAPVEESPFPEPEMEPAAKTEPEMEPAAKTEPEMEPAARTPSGPRTNNRSPRQPSSNRT